MGPQIDHWIGAQNIEADEFREEYDLCIAEAAKARTELAKRQWLTFADEWLKLMEAAESVSYGK